VFKDFFIAVNPAEWKCLKVFILAVTPALKFPFNENFLQLNFDY